jgi:hypothetical protein
MRDCASVSRRTEPELVVTIWDDELESLAESVRAVFGDGAVLDAIARAIQATPSKPDAIDDDLLALFPPEGIEPSDVISVAEAMLALKAEFRRILTAH